MTRKEAWQIGKLILTGNKGVFAGAIGLIIVVMLGAMLLLSAFIITPITLFLSVEDYTAITIVTALILLLRAFTISVLTLSFTGLCYRLYCGQQCRASVVLYYLVQPKILLKKIGLDLILWVVPFTMWIIISMIIGDSPLSFVIFLLFVILGLMFLLYSIDLAGNIILIVYPDLPFWDFIKISFQVGLRNIVTQFIMSFQVFGILFLAVLIPSLVLSGIEILLIPIVLGLYIGGVLLSLWQQVSLTVYYTAYIVQSGYIPDGRIEV